jgi:hypothetical protein
VIGVLATLAGGYVCARLAGRRELGLSAAQGALALAVGYLTAIGGADALAKPRFLAVAFGCGLLGGMLGRLHNETKRQSGDLPGQVRHEGDRHRSSGQDTHIR